MGSMSDQTNQCIYCKRSGVTFNREHVIPEAFGTYGAQTMHLHEEVCEDCNKGFGRRHDLILARDSFEGHLRAKLLPSRNDEPDCFRPRRVKLTFPGEEKYGHLSGARLEIDWSTMSPKLVSQVIIRSQSGEQTSYTIEELEKLDDAYFQSLPRGSIRIVATDTASVDKLEKVIRAKGRQLVTPVEATEIPSAAAEPSVLLNTYGQIDDLVWRGIARVAFNYLAKIQGAAYVLSPKFDRIRNFIVQPNQDRALVRVIRKPILSDESHHWRSFHGHLVLFETQERGLLCRVSLFNSITYEIILCPDLGLYYSLSSGHAFDPFDHVVFPLISTKRILVGRNLQ